MKKTKIILIMIILLQLFSVSFVSAITVPISGNSFNIEVDVQAHTNISSSISGGTFTISVVVTSDYPDMPTNFISTAYNSTQINLSWVKDDEADYTRIQYNTGSYPTSISDGINAYNNTGTSYNKGELSPSTKYYFSAFSFNATNKAWSLSYVTTYNTTKSIAGMYPLSSDVFSIKVYIEYYAWVNWRNWWHEYLLNFDTPTNFVAASFNDSAINLSWVKDVNATHTYIVRKIGSYPMTISDGANVYNGTGNFFNDTYLNLGTFYYYSAWAYNSTQNYYTDTYATAHNTTNPGEPTYLHDTSSTTTSISLAWTKGTNATNTIIRYSDFDYPATYTSNTSGYNSTDSSCTIGNLTENTTYYFRAWGHISFNGYNFWSRGNSSDNATTVSSAGSPIGFIASTNNDTSIALSWTKAYGSLKTRIQRKVGSYPTSITDGTNVYNDTGTTYSNTGLSPVTHYYYRAWGWNSLEFSTGYASANNITTPSKPINFVGSLSGTTLTITWIKGTGATRTVINKGLSSYPTSPTNGTSIYNGTGVFTTLFGITDFYYFRGWSYAVIDGVTLFSEPVDLIYGGITIYVYNESKPTQKISFNLLITNNEGSQTYSKVGVSSPCFIDLADIPIGNKTIFIISNNSYKQRTYYEDIALNTFYNFSFYIPPLTTPGGGGGGSSTEENRTQLYLLTVYNRYDQTLQDVKIDVKKYINTTGHYESIGIIYTDAAGQANIYLIPFTLYQFTCSKEGFITGISYWTPTNLIQTHTFVLDFETNPAEPPKNPYNYITFYASFIDNTTLFIRVLDSSGNLSDATIYIYKNTTLDYTYNFTTVPLFLNFTGGNITLADYKVVLYIRNHPDFGSYNFSTIITKLSSQQGLLLNLDLQIGSVLGNPGANVGVVISWLALLFLGLAMFVLLSFGRYWAGIGIASVGLVFGLFEVAFGIAVTGALQIVSFVVYCIVLGALMELGKAKLGRGGIQ